MYSSLITFFGRGGESEFGVLPKAPREQSLITTQVPPRAGRCEARTETQGTGCKQLPEMWGKVSGWMEKEHQVHGHQVSSKSGERLRRANLTW